MAPHRVPREAGPPLTTRWRRFAGALATTLRALDEDQCLVLVRKDRPWFVQFIAQGAHGLRAEMVADANLDAEDRLGEPALSTATRLGWLPAEVREGAEAEERNSFVQWDAPVPYTDAARLAVDTFVEVLATTDPERLCYRCFSDDGTTILLPTLGLKAWSEEPDVAMGLDADAIRERLLVLLRLATDTADLQPDSDGDLPIAHGEHSVFVRVFDDPPIVRVFSPALADTKAGPSRDDAINELNVRLPFLKWTVQDDAIIASVDLFGQPLVDQHVLDACELVAEAVAAEAGALQARLGGKTFLGTYQPPTEPDASGGYL
jgi:hypothetical protein